MPDLNNPLTTKDYFNAASASYQDDVESSEMKGWKIIDQDPPDGSINESGYAAIAYEAPDGSIVIAHRGTDQLIDFGSNFPILNREIPPQYEDASSFTSRVINLSNLTGNQIEGEQIVHTGHSLGGSLSQLLAHKYGAQSIAFDPPGVVEIIENNSEIFGDDDIDTDKFTTVVAKNAASEANTQIVGENFTRIDVGDNNPFTQHGRESLRKGFGEDGEISSEFILESGTIGGKIIHTLVDGAVVVDKITQPSEDIAEELAGGIVGGLHAAEDAAENLAGGIVEGLDAVEDAAEDLAGGIVGGLRASEDIAEELAEGIVGGINTISDKFHNGDDENPDAAIIESIKQQKELLNELGSEAEQGFVLPDSLPATGASDGDVANIAAELEANIDLLFQNMQKYTSTINGI